MTVRGTKTRKEAILRVIDQGRGVPEEELEHVFEPFYRGAPAQDQTGTGLGLAIARGFAEANGGRLWAESRPGQGAVFALALPTGRGAACVTESRGLILVVDDEPQILRALGTNLRGAGYDVVQAANGESALLDRGNAAAGRGRARPRAPRPLGDRRLPRAADMERGADPDPVGGRRGDAEGRGAGRRRRRLRHQAVRHGRAAGPAARGDAPRGTACRTSRSGSAG